MTTSIYVEPAVLTYAALDRAGKKPTLTEQLLFAILGQLVLTTELLDQRLKETEVGVRDANTN